MFPQTDDELLKSRDISKQTSDTLRSFKERAENVPNCRAYRQSVLKSCGFDLKFPVCSLYINIVIRLGIKTFSRGYFKAVHGYEFYFRILIISRSQVGEANEREIFSTRVEKFIFTSRFVICSVYTYSDTNCIFKLKKNFKTPPVKIECQY